jgi:hypothetical protein
MPGCTTLGLDVATGTWVEVTVRLADPVKQIDWMRRYGPDCGLPFRGRLAPIKSTAQPIASDPRWRTGYVNFRQRNSLTPNQVGLDCREACGEDAPGQVGVK